MKLSTLYTAVPDYIEFAWLTTPAAAAQSVSSNSIVTLTLNTEVQDTAGIVAAPGTAPASANQFILPAGTYYFEATCPLAISGGERHTAVLGLYNVTDSAWVSKGKGPRTVSDTAHQMVCFWNSQFAITGSKTFDLRVYARNATATAFSVTNGGGGTFGLEAFTSGVSTDPIDQRTTIKLWKLK
jgi:hypothetical protein